ncbi:DUF1415 family protein [Alteromonas sediminis]|uniref:DUF1415 family protein n=1 Tax=Alteromonas sediminis TaxID=2259342 RepID=UPI00140494D0|nr:DUF1415 domain-containing protein [Alteromonas sediminis]
MNTKEINAVLFEWIDHWIIGQNFCPFARPVRLKESINITLSDAKNVEQMMTILEQACQSLLSNPDRSTTLVTFTHGAKDFFSFLDWVDTANLLIQQCNWEGVFQLATFHPDYLFDGEPVDSPTHYTNRAPLPILHIIREAEISTVMPSQKEADVIVARNQARCEALGTDFFVHQFKGWQARLHQAIE